MLAKLSFAARWCATAFSFFIFGVGGVLIPLLVVPVLYCLPGGSRQREINGQKFIHLAFGRFIWLMRFLGVLTYKVDDLQALKKAQLVLANHPSLLDVVFLISLIPNANCVVKGALLRNPFMRGPIKAAGYTINNGDSDDVIEASKTVFDKGQSMIVFPEGTRSCPGQTLTFKRGAANIALRTGVDITPVIISCQPSSLTKQDKWYQIPAKPMHFSIQVKPQISVQPFSNDYSPTKGARALTEYLTAYFNKEVSLHDSAA